MEYTFDEMVERMTKVLNSLDGASLAELYNREFGDGLEYIGDDLFRQ